MGLQSSDVAIACFLAAVPGATFERIADGLGMSLSTAHKGVRRLSEAGLVNARRRINRHAFLEFVEHGFGYVFPARVGERRQRGVPTAYAGPDLANEIIADEPLVWPDESGDAVGKAITPLVPKASALRHQWPAVYAMLADVDAIRVGRARERELGVAALKRHMYGVGSGAFAV